MIEGQSVVSLRSLAPSLTRVTVAAAVGAALHIGQGNPKIVDQRAVDFSRALLAQMDIDGAVISCEGPKDNAPAFSRREKVGTRDKGQRSNSLWTLSMVQLPRPKAERMLSPP